MPIPLSSSGLKNLFRLLTNRNCSTVKRPATTLIKEKGWTLTTGSDPQWQGYYRSKYGSYKGRIENLGDPKFYIQIPEITKQLRDHKHWICFHDQHSANWYWVHLSPVPKDLDSGILAIERNLNDALALALPKTA